MGGWCWWGSGHRWSIGSEWAVAMVVLPEPSYLQTGCLIGLDFPSTQDSDGPVVGKNSTPRLDVSLRHLQTGRTNISISGNLLLLASTTAVLLGLTWEGIESPWGSVKVLAPLILGLCGLVAFLFYEGLVASHPIVRHCFCLLI